MQKPFLLLNGEENRLYKYGAVLLQNLEPFTHFERSESQ